MIFVSFVSSTYQQIQKRKIGYHYINVSIFDCKNNNNIRRNVVRLDFELFIFPTNRNRRYTDNGP